MRRSYANVTATLALVIALGGTSYAAIKIPKNSVASKQVKDGSLNSGDLAPGARGLRKVMTVTSPADARECFSTCEGTEVTEAAVRCPDGFVATGGGVVAPTLNDARVLESRPVGGGWSGKVRFEIAQSPAMIPDPTVYAICIR